MAKTPGRQRKTREDGTGPPKRTAAVRRRATRSVQADRVELHMSATGLVAAGETALDQSAGAVVVTRAAHVRDSAIAFLVARDVDGTGNRVLFGPRAAFAFGAGLALGFGLLRLLRRG